MCAVCSVNSMCLQIQLNCIYHLYCNFYTVLCNVYMYYTLYVCIYVLYVWMCTVCTVCIVCTMYTVCPNIITQIHVCTFKY